RSPASPAHLTALLPSLHPPPRLPSLPPRRSSDLAATLPVFPYPSEKSFVHRDLLPDRYRSPSTSRPEKKFRARHNPVIHCPDVRSEEHTSELQSRFDIVCRLLLEKKKRRINDTR